MVNINCEYSGYIERTGGVSLRAEGGRLVAATPLFGTVSARGLRGLAALVHGEAEGAMTVSATARPQLRPDWSVALDMREGFNWSEAPTLNVLGFHINLTRFVEPKIRSQLARVQADALASARKLDIRGKAETAWRHAFAIVQVSDTPQVWLRTTPQSVAFAGMRAHGDVLEGAIEISGTAETLIGGEPAASTPAPLPRVGHDVAAPGKFDIVVPVNIGYAGIHQQIQDFMSAHAGEDAPALRDVDIYPSNGKLVVGLRLSQAQGSGAGDWVYLTATPKLDADQQLVRFPDLTVTSPSGSASLNAWLANSDVLQALQQRLRVAYQTEAAKIVSDASARLTRSLGGGFRSEAQLASASVGGIQLNANELQINLHANGQLKILHGF